MRKIALLVKRRNKVYLFAKYLKIRKKRKNLTMLNSNYFSLRLRKELSSTNSSYVNTPKYTLYFIYYYYNKQIPKCLYKKFFIIKFINKTSLKLKKF